MRKKTACSEVINMSVRRGLIKHSAASHGQMFFRRYTLWASEGRQSTSHAGRCTRRVIPCGLERKSEVNMLVATRNFAHPSWLCHNVSGVKETPSFQSATELFVQRPRPVVSSTGRSSLRDSWHLRREGSQDWLWTSMQLHECGQWTKNSHAPRVI